MCITYTCAGVNFEVTGGRVSEVGRGNIGQSRPGEVYALSQKETHSIWGEPGSEIPHISDEQGSVTMEVDGGGAHVVFPLSLVCEAIITLDLG